jgi:transcriptional regulator with XRE-family HTH domain
MVMGILIGECTMLSKIVLKNPKKLKQVIIRKGFTERSLSEALGRSTSYINQIVNQNRNPKADTAKLICEKLEIEFEDYFFITNACKCKNK